MENALIKQKTKWVILITLVTMFAEIFYGILSHSMALTADGVHMGTHALALTITFIVCSVVSKFPDKEETLNALGGYTSALFLGLSALGIIYESGERFIHPQIIYFNEAILVAVLGLIVNIVCIWIMSEKGHRHRHLHTVNRSQVEFDCLEKGHTPENLNLKGAYLHIIADAFTSVIAIIALVLGKYFGWIVLDALIGILGGCIILKWSLELIKQSFKILLFGTRI